MGLYKITFSNHTFSWGLHVETPELSHVLSFKPEVGQNTALYTQLTTKYSVLIFAVPFHSAASSSSASLNPSSNMWSDVRSYHDVRVDQTLLVVCWTMLLPDTTIVDDSALYINWVTSQISTAGVNNWLIQYQPNN